MGCMKLLLTIWLGFNSVYAQASLLHVNEILPSHALREGGSAVGNGGGTVICRDPSTRVIKSAELLDFYEARVIRYFNTDIQKFCE